MSENLVFALFLLFPLLAGGAVALFYRCERAAVARAGLGRVILGNFLLTIFLVSLLFIGGEIYYRFVYDTTDALNYTKVSERWFRRHYVQNDAGFRDDVQYSAIFKGGKRRVSFLGDSFAAGHGVKNVEDRFANRIRQLHPELEVQVLATLGADTGAELTLMRECIHAGMQLDQVVLVYCLNDVADILPEWDAALQDIYSDAARGGWLRENSYLVDTLYHKFKAFRNPYMKNYFGFVRKGYEGETWDMQKRRLIALRDLVESHHGRLLVVTFPFLHLTQAPGEFRPVHQKLDEFWKQSGVPHLDLLPVFEGLRPEKITINQFDSHPNAYAHALAAKKIDQFLTEQMEKGVRPEK